MAASSTSGHELKMDRWHRYECISEDHPQCAGVVYRSVTTILGRAVPKDLSWWGMTIGAEAVQTLLERDYDIAAMSPVEVVDAIKAEKLTVRDRMGQAATRGTSIHQALEDYGTTGKLPTLTDFPASDRGYVRGLARFFMEYQPEIVASEVQVVSVEHEFAGTYDFEANIHGKVTGTTFTPDPAASTFTLGDLKTSRFIYPTSHFPQIEAYEYARIENGRTPTDVRAVLHVTATGGMSLVPSTFTFEDFLILKASSEVVRRGDSEGAKLKREVLKRG